MVRATGQTLKNSTSLQHLCTFIGSPYLAIHLVELLVVTTHFCFPGGGRVVWVPELRISGLQCVGPPKATTEVVPCVRKGPHPPERSEKPCRRRLRLGKVTPQILIFMHHKSLICKMVMRLLCCPRGVS